MTSIRKTKKLLKIRKKDVEITVRDWDIEYGNKALINQTIDLEFNKFGVTVVCCDIPCEFIPFRKMGQIYKIKTL